MDPQITNAHDDLFSNELDAAYSSVARLGKEKLLFAAREGLRIARGRVSLIHPDIAIEPVLLPGAMALLEQAGEYDLVIQLAQQAKNVTAGDLRPSSRGTMRDFERDVALATALAHCGFAKKDLESGRPAMGCARLEEALYMLREHGSGSAALAPELQVNIVGALSDLKADAVLDYLSQPLELADMGLRRQALVTLGGMLIQKDNTNSLDAAYVTQALDSLTADEICGVVDWQRVATSPPGTFSWLEADMLPRVGVAHIVTGFAARRPQLVLVAKTVLGIARSEHVHLDVAIHLAVCEVLLGAPTAALDLLEEDERHGEHLRSQAGLPMPPPRARSPYSAAAAAASLAFPERDGVMQFIRAASPDGESDLLPGLCLFVEQWMQRLAFPLIRDTKQRPPLASLAAYFDDPRTQKYLESRESGSRDIKSVISAAGTAVGKAAQAVVSLPTNVLRFLLGYKQIVYVAGATAILAALVFGGERLESQRRAMTGQAPGGAAAAGGVARLAVPSTTRPSNPKQQQQDQQQASKQKKEQLKARQPRQDHFSHVADSLLRDTAREVVKSWLDIKAEAMGPRHMINRLSSVLAEPMLSAVSSEALEAASSGWFWNIRPLRVRIDSIDESCLTPEGGYAVVVATVDESADLWATNGKKGDSYKTEYRVEYSMVRGKGGWKIASALVLGK